MKTTSSKPLSRPWRRRNAVAGLACAVSLAALTACGGGATTAADASAGGPGVPAGAGREEFRAALAGVEPITLTTQTSGSPGDNTSRAIEAYAEAVHDWSGGVITVDIAYAQSVAAPAEVDQALEDGRLDFSEVYTIYDPARYPVTDTLGKLLSAGLDKPGLVVGEMADYGTTLQTAWDTPAMAEEYEREGMRLFLPVIPAPRAMQVCTSDRSSLEAMRGAACGCPTRPSRRRPPASAWPRCRCRSPRSTRRSNAARSTARSS
ncbi:hypothetical protein BJF78_14455 [Pseudonocardia sp. CNS-139]|nr:hypothetical protein BJF78_14455 [Pseudonocardia sp. CNS-139]